MKCIVVCWVSENFKNYCLLVFDIYFHHELPPEKLYVQHGMFFLFVFKRNKRVVFFIKRGKFLFFTIFTFFTSRISTLTLEWTSSFPPSFSSCFLCFSSSLLFFSFPTLSFTHLFIHLFNKYLWLKPVLGVENTEYFCLHGFYNFMCPWFSHVQSWEKASLACQQLATLLFQLHII